MHPYLIVSFYQFVRLEDYESLKPLLLKSLNAHQLKGTLILASEGINGSVSGTPEAVQAFFDELSSDARFNDLAMVKNYHDTIPFKKAKVKLRQEIVSLGVEGIDPKQIVGDYLSPAAWNELISDPDTVVIDTRNDYEFAMGTFQNAINPVTDNFRSFPEYVQDELMDKKDKKIAMFCTGGIRCEKSTAYLKTLGFSNVYHLKGGILNYLETTPENESTWEGACFVFDDRVGVTANLEALPRGTVDSEWKHNYKQYQN